MIDLIPCKQCNHTMVKATKVEASFLMQIVCLFVFMTGASLLLVVPLGTVLGIVLMIGALSVGYKKINVWKCKHCGYYFERERS